MVYWGYVSQFTEQNELGLSESVTNWTSEEDIVKIDKKYCITVANGLSDAIWCHARYEKPLKNPPLISGEKYVETYSSSSAPAPDPEERVLDHIH